MVTHACLRYAREGQNVTQAGPKCHTSRAKMSHKGQNVTQSCYNDVIMTSQITSLTIVYSTVYSGAEQREHQSSASLAFVRGLHRGPVNSPHKWPVTRKIFPFDDVIMNSGNGSIPSDNNPLPEPNRWQSSSTPCGVTRPQWVKVLKALGEKISPRKLDPIRSYS